MHVCVFVWTDACVRRVCTHACVCVHARMCVHAHECVHVCMCVRHVNASIYYVYYVHWSSSVIASQNSLSQGNDLLRLNMINIPSSVRSLDRLGCQVCMMDNTTLLTPWRNSFGRNMNTAKHQISHKCDILEVIKTTKNKSTHSKRACQDWNMLGSLSNSMHVSIIAPPSIPTPKHTITYLNP